jgi:hypothetical protein
MNGLHAPYNAWRRTSLRAPAAPSFVAPLLPSANLAEVAIACTIAVGMVVGAMLGVASVSMWLVSLTLTMLAARLAHTRHTPLRDASVLCVLSFDVLSIIGLYFIATYRSIYGLSFGPYADDSLYFNEIVGNLPSTFQSALYDAILRGFYALVSPFVRAPDVTHLLPVNWAFGAIAVLLSRVLSDEVSGVRLPMPLLFAAVIGNWSFSDTVTHLYRDGLMLVFFLAALIASNRRQYVRAAILAGLCGMVRPAHGALALFFAIFCAASTGPAARRRTHVAVCVSLVLLGCLFWADREWNLGRRLRTVTAVDSSGKDTIIETAKDRFQTMMVGPQEAEPTGIQLLARSKLGLLALPIFTVFTPVRLSPLVAETRAEITSAGGTRTTFSVRAFQPGIVLEWLTVFLWLLVAPLIVLGVWEGFRGGDKQRAVVVLFLVTVAAVSFISFQARHKTAFIVLFPTLMASVYRRTDLRRSRSAVAQVVFTGIMLINVMSALMYIMGSSAP